MDVLNPCGARTRRFKPLAPRPGSLTIPVLLGRIVDVTGSFPAAFLAAAAIQALAFVTACFTRDTGRRAAPA